ncbi:MAG: alpha-L-arabinofuranosidase C-terminal domain-containing protein, partial [Tepidisphaeraceae bacterium]
TLSLQSSDGRTIYARAQVNGLTASWKKFEADLKTSDSITPTADARYALTIDRPGAVSLSFVSLFPPTYNHRPNGLRQDLMQMLVDLKPKFLRFPGGNYVEGGSFATRFDWKKTIGPVEERPGHPGCWGYRSSDGMGLLEFLEWTQDMGAEPVLAVFAGYTLDKKYVEAGPELQPYVDEALEEIEYVTGGPETTWGRQRAKDGHPEPFKLRYVEIGNEDFFDQSGSYDKRFAQFYDAIKAKHPELKIISTIGNEHPKAIQVASRVPDVVDEHYYRSADEFMRISPTFYEKYSREKRPEIFVGEWASYPDARIKPWTPAAKKLPPTPNMKAALGDACFMAAMERNADLVIMQCYAPLLVNVNAGAWQWGPDLIGYDALRAFGSPSYYAIKMFNTHLGNERLALTHADTSVQASATRDSEHGVIYLKLVNPDSKPATVQIDLKDAAGLQPTAQVLTLSGPSSATNSIDHPKTIVPAESTLNGVSPHFSFTVKPESICVISISERAPK